MEKDDLKEQIDRYYQLSCSTTHLYESWAKQRGITYKYVLTICTLLSNQEHCTQKMICEQWGLPKQTVNTILKDLKRKEYVTFIDLPSDRRNKVISLTDSGREYANKISTELYNLDYYVVEKMGLDCMRELNENLALYLEYYHEAQNDSSLIE